MNDIQIQFMIQEIKKDLYKNSFKTNLSEDFVVIGLRSMSPVLFAISLSTRSSL